MPGRSKVHPSNMAAYRVGKCLELRDLIDLESEGHFYQQYFLLSSVLKQINHLREEGSFCDVILRIRNREFRAHRLILSAYSDYFRSMFSSFWAESGQAVVNLQDDYVTPDALEAVLKFMYTTEVDITAENLCSILLAADHLQVKTLTQKVDQYLQERFQNDPGGFGVDEYIEILILSERFQLNASFDAEQHAALKFLELSRKEDFYELLTVEALEAILALVNPLHPFAQQIMRNMRGSVWGPEWEPVSQTQVFQVLLKWIDHDRKQRVELAARLLHKINLDSVDPRDLRTAKKKLQEVPECVCMLHQAIVEVYGEEADSPLPSLDQLDISLSTLDMAQYCPVAGNQVLLAMGGYSPNAHYYDPVQKDWFSLPKLLYPWKTCLTEVGDCRCNPSLLCVGDSIYVFGGETSSGLGVQENLRYNISTNSWDEIPRVGYHFRPACVLLGDCIYLISSHHSFKLHVPSLLWSEVSHQPHELKDTAVAAYRGRIYVIGGTEEPPDSAVQDRVQVYDPETDTWTDQAPTRRKHSHAAALVINDQLYIAGGLTPSVTDNGEMMNSQNVEVYDEQLLDWTLVPQPNVAANNLGAFQIGQRLYFMLGRECFDTGVDIPEDEAYALDAWTDVKSFEFGASVVCCNVDVDVLM
ncbi:PREDICTED: kelch-like protein 12 [Branchiostoma belcheri]|uniref:Kelch-like protein 12 n=1 Tax=Branchiostoma belcheri TaxID=7741 RepID=A0A6P4YK48_BRABE|nr:PREDICTED: kelch-like protein 12 [Branchiostoma belcheri]